MMQVMDIRQIGNAQSTQERYRLLLLFLVSLFGLCVALQDHHHFEHGDYSI
jgi:hypothetical protein